MKKNYLKWVSKTLSEREMKLVVGGNGCGGNCPPGMTCSGGVCSSGSNCYRCSNGKEGTCDDCEAELFEKCPGGWMQWSPVNGSCNVYY